MTKDRYQILQLHSMSSWWATAFTPFEALEMALNKYALAMGKYLVTAVGMQEGTFIEAGVPALPSLHVETLPTVRYGTLPDWMRCR